MTREPLQVLLIEDNLDHARIIHEFLWETAPAAYKITNVDRLASGLALLAKQHFDVLLLDLGLPDSAGLNALTQSQAQVPALPIILLTSHGDKDLALEAVRAGAQDYLFKDQVDGNLLQRAILYAIERKRAEEEVRKRNSALLLLTQVISASASTVNMATVLETTCRELARALDVPHATAALIDESHTTLHTVAEYLSNGQPSSNGALMKIEDDPAAKYVLDHMAPLAVTDTQNESRFSAVQDSMRQRGTAALMLVPLIVHDQLLGTIGVDTTEKRTFTTEEISLAAIAATVAAQGIKTAQLFNETQRRLHRLSALRNIDITIATSLDSNAILDVLLDQVIEQLGVDAAGVLLLDRDTQILEFAAGRGFRSDAITRTSLRLGEGRNKSAVLQQRIVNIPNLPEIGDAFGRAALLEGEAFITYYSAPLVAKGRIQGLLELFHREAFDPNPEWFEFLETLIAHAAIAIDNAILFDDLQLSNVELTEAYETTLEGWVNALDLRDEETEGHTRRVTELTEALAQRMEIGSIDILNVRRGALLHDIGKMGIPDSILLKPGPLSDEEWEIMRRHPVYAYELLTPIDYLHPALEIPYCHHERWDGTGYPRQLQGDDIPLAARIFAVVDVWDALRSDRPYRDAWAEKKVIAHIAAQSGTHFDPHVANTFLAMISEQHTSQ